MSSKRKSSVVNFYKLFIIQSYGYMAFIPFVFAFFTLSKKYNLGDIILFSIGVIFVAILLLINHLEPSVKVTPLRVILFSIDRNRPIILQRKDLTEIVRVKSRSAILYFGKLKYEVKLSKKNIDRLINILEEES